VEVIKGLKTEEETVYNLKTLDWPLISYPAFQLGVFLTGSWIQFEPSKILDLLHEEKKKVI